jgi:uridine kinase
METLKAQIDFVETNKRNMSIEELEQSCPELKKRCPSIFKMIVNNNRDKYMYKVDAILKFADMINNEKDKNKVNKLKRKAGWTVADGLLPDTLYTEEHLKEKNKLLRENSQ